jgi:lipopolysaccharide/colanic/teichoic acid biosynthesis glycosyltransferase
MLYSKIENNSNMNHYSLYIKRILDILVSLIGLLITSPALLLTILLLSIFQKGKIFFFQSRPGKNSKIFRIVKFQSMNDIRDTNGKLLPDRERITPVGRLIRSTSLDELPQLINVIKGDMSLIGPRPLLKPYLELYSKEQARRQEVRPGITGWAQVNGRNAISWKKRFEMDVWYVDNLSFSLDVKILWLTVIKVFKREGINANDAATMKPFTGNN